MDFTSPSFPIFILAILVALSVHEWAHAFVADRLGDPTPRENGRLTLNPIAHLDPIGTLMFFLVRFGWGKPVPVDARYFRHPKRDTALVALAGPVSNLLLAIFCMFGMWLMGGDIAALAETAATQNGSVGLTFLGQFLIQSLVLNLALMAFNLLPIAPLDGSKVLAAFIPTRLEDRYDRLMAQGPFILLGIIIVERLLNIPILSLWVFTVINSVAWVLGAVTGMQF